MSTQYILIIDEKGEEVKTLCSGYRSHNESITFFTKNSEIPNFYPTYHSGKCKGPIAFKKDGTLVLSKAFFETLKAQNGFLRDGYKNVYVSAPSLDIQYTREKIYDYRLVELLKVAVEKDIGHIHSLETLKAKYDELYYFWDDLLDQRQLDIRVEKRPMIYDHLWIAGYYIGNSNYLNRLIEHFGFPDGESVFNFKTEISRLREEPFVYNAEAMGWLSSEKGTGTGTTKGAL